MLIWCRDCGWQGNWEGTTTDDSDSECVCPSCLSSTLIECSEDCESCDRDTKAACFAVNQGTGEHISQHAHANIKTSA